MRRLSYYFNETINGLRRHGLMVFAAVSTVFISLFLLGGAWLIRQEANLFADYTTEKVQVAVYLQDNVSTSDQSHLLSLIQHMPEVESVRYESKQQAFERYKKIFANQPQLTQNMTLLSGRGGPNPDGCRSSWASATTPVCRLRIRSPLEAFVRNEARGAHGGTRTRRFPAGCDRVAWRADCAHGYPGSCALGGR